MKKRPQAPPSRIASPDILATRGAEDLAAERFKDAIEAFPASSSRSSRARNGGSPWPRPIPAAPSARQLEAMAMRRLAAGDRDGAARLLGRSILLHRTPTALALRQLVAPTRT